MCPSLINPIENTVSFIGFDGFGWPPPEALPSTGSVPSETGHKTPPVKLLLNSMTNTKRILNRPLTPPPTPSYYHTFTSSWRRFVGAKQQQTNKKRIPIFPVGVEGGGGEGGGGTGRRKKEKGKDKKLSKTKRMKRSHTHKSSHSIGLCRYDTRYCYDPQDQGKGGGFAFPPPPPFPHLPPTPSSHTFRALVFFLISCFQGQPLPSLLLKRSKKKERGRWRLVVGGGGRGWGYGRKKKSQS